MVTDLVHLKSKCTLLLDGRYLSNSILSVDAQVYFRRFEVSDLLD